MSQQQDSSIFQSQGVTYYTVRVLQRLSLLLAAGSSVILWCTLLTLSHGQVFTNALQGTQYTSAQELSVGITNESSKLSHYAMGWSVLALATTLAMLLFTRVAHYEKRLVVDSVVIAGFLLVVSTFYQPILQFILSRLAG